MPKYDVHIFVPVGIKVRSVDALSQVKAIATAWEWLDPSDWLDRNICYCDDRPVGLPLPPKPEIHVERILYAEDEPVRYLVDVQGDRDYLESLWYGPSGKRVLGPIKVKRSR